MHAASEIVMRAAQLSPSLSECTSIRVASMPITAGGLQRHRGTGGITAVCIADAGVVDAESVRMAGPVGLTEHEPGDGWFRS